MVDKEKMIGMMVDRYEQFVLSERIILELISMGDRYVEAEKQWGTGEKTIPFTWDDRTFDLAFEPDRLEIIYATRNILENLSKEERFDVFCVMEIGRWIDYNRGFGMDAVSDFINWADEWYVEGKHTDFKAEYLWGKTTLSKWLRTGWDTIGTEYKRRRRQNLQKASVLTKLEPLPHIIGHVAVIDNQETGKSNLRLIHDPGIVLTLEYKGVTGTVEFSRRDYMYHGEFNGFDYEGRTLEELIDSFRGEVDRHPTGGDASGTLAHLAKTC